MKLVDILAQELKEWPDCARYILFDHANSCYADLGQGYSPLGIDCSDFDDDATDKSCTTVYRAQWQAAVDALRAEANPAESMTLHHQEVGRITRQWTGEGLPPVDLPCQWHSDIQTGWQEVVVLAYSGESAWIQPKGKPSIIVGNPANFRPILTPEQIAAEERENIIKEMQKDLPEWILKGGYGHIETVCAMLSDAGYRKFEIVDN